MALIAIAFVVSLVALVIDIVNHFRLQRELRKAKLRYDELRRKRGELI